MAQNPVFTITMSDGREMKGELYPEIAPQSVGNFTALANSGFYDGLTFHRVIPGFMIQGGDPKGIGIGGPGYCIKGEFAANGVNNPLKHTYGVLSMARSMMPDSAGTVLHHDQRQSASGRTVCCLRQGAGGHGSGGGYCEDEAGRFRQAARTAGHGVYPCGYIRTVLSLRPDLSKCIEARKGFNPFLRFSLMYGNGST